MKTNKTFNKVHINPTETTFCCKYLTLLIKDIKYSEHIYELKTKHCAVGKMNNRELFCECQGQKCP